MPRQAFFSFDLRQQVNQWLCFALIGVMAFAVVLYFFVHKTEAFGINYVDTRYQYINSTE